MRNFLMFVGVIFIIVVGGYFAYQKFIKGKSDAEISNAIISGAQETTEINNITKAELEYKKGNYQQAIAEYQAALALPKTGDKSITDSDRTYAEMRIADAQRELAISPSGLTAAQKRESGKKAIASYEKFIKDHPTDKNIPDINVKLSNLKSHPNVQ